MNGMLRHHLPPARARDLPLHLPAVAGGPIPSVKGSYTILFGQAASIGYVIESDHVVPLNTVTNTTLRPVKLPLVMDWDEATRA